MWGPWVRSAVTRRAVLGGAFVTMAGEAGRHGEPHLRGTRWRRALADVAVARRAVEASQRDVAPMREHDVRRHARHLHPVDGSFRHGRVPRRGGAGGGRRMALRADR